MLQRLESEVASLSLSARLMPAVTLKFKVQGVKLLAAGRRAISGFGLLLLLLQTELNFYGWDSVWQEI